MTGKHRYFASALSLMEEAVGSRGRLLDIGGGIGYFAEVASRRGWYAYSLDVSATATRIAAGRIGPTHALMALDDSHASSFDAVTLWCVVAHTRDPHDLMRMPVKRSGRVACSE